MVFSGFGLAGLLYSLILTRRATNVAVDATKDADKALLIATRNADAATALAKASAENAERELRAYLDLRNPTPFRIKERDARTELCAGFTVVCTNYGKTPAVDVRRTFRVYTATGDVPKDLLWVHASRNDSVAPGGEHVFNDFYQVDKAVWGRMLSNDEPFIIVTHLEYRDVFKKRHTIEASWKTDGAQAIWLIPGSKKGT